MGIKHANIRSLVVAKVIYADGYLTTTGRTVVHFKFYQEVPTTIHGAKNLKVMHYASSAN